MLIALRWLPLHLILGFLVGRRRKGRDKGSSILIICCNRRAKPCPEAPPSRLGLTPKRPDLGHMTALAARVDGKTGA